MCPYSYFQWNGYFWGPRVSFETIDDFSVKVTIFFSRIGVSWTHSLPFRFLPLFWLLEIAILSKASKSDNFESHNSLKLSFTNIRGLRSFFVGCKYFLESNSLDILDLCETNFNDPTDSANFFARGYLLLIRKDSATHMHGLAVYVKEGLPVTLDLSLEISQDS